MNTRNFSSALAILTLAASFIGCGQDVTGPDQAVDFRANRPSLETKSTDATDFTSSATNEQLAAIARYLGYRVVKVEGSLDEPASLSEAVHITQWREQTLDRMARDNVSLADIILALESAEDSAAAPDGEMSKSQMFELAGHFDYATPDVSDPDNPASLSEAVAVTTWLGEFENYLGTSVSLNVLIQCTSEVLEGRVHLDAV